MEGYFSVAAAGMQELGRVDCEWMLSDDLRYEKTHE
jgi:hypothetical protein